MNRIFKEHPDIELIEYYGSREKNSGDFLIKVGNHQIRVDHKSTTNETKAKLVKDWLPYLVYCGLNRQDRDGRSLPIITINAKNHNTIWTMGYNNLPNLDVTNEARIKPDKESFHVKTGWLYDIGEGVGKISFDSYTAYVIEFENFIRRIKNVQWY